MSRQQSLLLSLPIELRLVIYKHLLAPNCSSGRLIVSRDQNKEKNLGSGPRKSKSFESRSICGLSPASGAHAPHEPKTVHVCDPSLDDQTCGCNQVENDKSIVDKPSSLYPAILRTNRQIHREAVPLLYSQHTFIGDSFYIYLDWEGDSCGTLLYWLETLSPTSRNCIRSIRLPLRLLPSVVVATSNNQSPLRAKLRANDRKLCAFSTRVMTRTFQDIAALVPNLQTVELEFRMQKPLLFLFEIAQDRFSVAPPHFLGPLKAFANVRLVVTAAARGLYWRKNAQHQIPVSLLSRVLENTVFRIRVQLLATRRKREERRFRQTLTALRALDYEEVDGWRDELEMLNEE